jgi:hypothetical protein
MGGKAMHDNPLGPMLHLKELDRQAFPKLRPVRRIRGHGFNLTALGAALAAVLARLWGGWRAATTEARRPTKPNRVKPAVFHMAQRSSDS